MGTRSTVKFYSEFDVNKEKPILTVFQMFDGYISGVGYQLARFLKDKKLINGISNQTIEQGFANGMGCLAAQYLHDIKTNIGSVYCVPGDSKEFYNYDVVLVNGNLIIEVSDFKGTAEQLLNFNEGEGEE